VDWSMDSKVAVVFGAGAGSGRATARLLASRGAKVVIGEIARDRGEETVRLIEHDGGTARFMECSVEFEDQVKATIDFAVSEFGRLDCAVNNVGSALDPVLLPEVTAEGWDWLQRINLRSTFFGMKHELAAMQATGGGSIVNIASAGGLVGQPKMAAYNASKFGMIGLTKSTALDYAKLGVRVNAVCPGAILSEGMQAAIDADPHFADGYLAGMPNGRFCRPEEIAEVVAWLCSDSASIVTGVALPADGGMVAD
jgi:NAD(P)-dependent dehydrogenase (short-subunit alcohol dehydrogenase family)